MEDRLIEEFGCQRISADQKARIERLSRRPLHRFLKRDIFVTHRDLDRILDAVEAGEEFYIYTGRGPTSPTMHVGHLIPFQFAQYLQEVFGAFVVIQITDDEKYLFRGLEMDEIRTNTIANIRDIIACGFNMDRTFIFSNLAYFGEMYGSVLRIQRRITNNQSRAAFGIEGIDNIGKTAYVATQAAPAFASTFPFLKKGTMCLVPQGLDQDPYFRLTRDVAEKMNEPKPALIHSGFIPSLKGMTDKMSSSDSTSVIFLTDSPKVIREKIFRSVTGGRDTKEDQLKRGV